MIYFAFLHCAVENNDLSTRLTGFTSTFVEKRTLPYLKQHRDYILSITWIKEIVQPSAKCPGTAMLKQHEFYFKVQGNNAKSFSKWNTLDQPMQSGCWALLKTLKVVCRSSITQLSGPQRPDKFYFSDRVGARYSLKSSVRFLGFFMTTCKTVHCSGHVYVLNQAEREWFSDGLWSKPPSTGKESHYECSGVSLTIWLLISQ